MRLSDLPPRQRAMAELVSKGYGNHEIADELCISASTVRNQLSIVYRELVSHGDLRELGNHRVSLARWVWEQVAS